MNNIKVIAMRPDELEHFVHEIARPGDIATAYDSKTKRRYVYFCTHDNIGKSAKPAWMMVDERSLWEYRFNSMSLEEKVDFLIDRYISENT